jgi:hypothetical protein
MTDCETVFWLRKIDAATTFVEFRVRADPGGSSPTGSRWFFLSLRERVQEDRNSLGEASSKKLFEEALTPYREFVGFRGSRRPQGKGNNDRLGF